MEALAQEWDASGKPIQASSSPAVPQHTEWDSSGKPISAPQKGFFESAADASGLSAFTPSRIIDTVKGIPAAMVKGAKDSVSEVKAGYQAHKEGNQADADLHYIKAIPIIGNALNTATDQYAAGNNAGAAGTVVGTVGGLVAPEAVSAGLGKLAALAPKVAPAVAGAADAVGDAAQSQAGKIINRATGTLKADFKRGANPGRGYLAEDGGIATSIGDLADKADAAKSSVGDRLGKAYTQADAAGVKIPAQDVIDALHAPMQKVVGANYVPSSVRDQVLQHAADISPALQQGAQRGYFTPSEVFDLKKNIADFTNWGDQSQANLSKVKQQQTGALGGLLEEAVPEVAPLNQSYQDLTKMAGRARERANTGSQPLTSHIRSAGGMALGALLGGGAGGELGGLAGAGAVGALRSIPGRTGIATGLYKAGGLLKSAAEKTGDAASEGADSVGSPVSSQAALPSGSAKWAASGADKLAQHITATPGGITADDIAGLPKRVLIAASDLTPGSKAMTALVAQIAANKSKEDDSK